MPAKRYVVSPQGGGPPPIVGPLQFQTTSPLSSATQGLAYTFNAIEAQGGVAPYTFSLQSHSSIFPDSWAVSGAGVVTGTPVVRPLLLGTKTGLIYATKAGTLYVRATS